MTLDTNVQNLAVDVGGEMKALRTLINGNVAGLASLTTSAKLNLVDAINEVNASVGGAGASIVDTGTSTSSVWSSSKTSSQIAAATAALVNAAPAALDTLKELSDALGGDASFAATTAAAIGSKAPIASPTFTGTVGGVTKAMVGLGSVDNTSDASKPVSTATASALAAKAPLASPTFTGTVSGITKTMVGLGSVDNTSDAAKPISSAQASVNAAQATANASFASAAAVGSTTTNYVTIFRAALV